MGRLDEKVVLITGAGAGIGRTAALLFAKEGAQVTILEINDKAGQETEKLVQEEGEDTPNGAVVHPGAKNETHTYGNI